MQVEMIRQTSLPMKGLSIKPVGFVLIAIMLLHSVKPAYCQQNKGWINISNSVLSNLKAKGTKIGYPGGTAGVVVNPSNGDVYMVVPDNGLWKSTDQGKTFVRVDGGKIGGRCETGFALDFDPSGKRLACFMIYGACASTADAGKTWTAWSTNHLDFGVVDWAKSGKAMVAFRNESGGVLCMTTDGGKTWRDIGRPGPDKKPIKEDREFKAVGLFDSKTILASKGSGILRSVDGGKAWAKVHDAKLVSPVMRVHKDVGYWMSDQGILASKDNGATWKIVSKVNAVFGPWFGADEMHMVVVGKDGFSESRDAGQTWKLVAPLPPEFNTRLVGPNYAWDVNRNVFYSSSMGKPTYKFQR